MAPKTLQDVIKIVEAQQKEIQRLKDIHEVQNLMGRWVHRHEGNNEIRENMFAMNTPGVSSEVADGGVYVGEGIIKAMKKQKPIMDFYKKGSLYTHPLTSPVIEVAGDGKTAKGVWMSPGYEAGGKDPATNKPIPCFVYTKYGIDFAKEDGVWKVWHYHVYRMFMTPWNVPITEEWEKNEGAKLRKALVGDKPREKPVPDLPTTYDHPYAVDNERELVPAPPDPYETFSETFSYGP